MPAWRASPSPRRRGRPDAGHGLCGGHAGHPRRLHVRDAADVPLLGDAAAVVRDVAPKYMRTAPTIVDLVGDRDVKASTDVRHIAIGAPAGAA